MSTIRSMIRIWSSATPTTKRSDDGILKRLLSSQRRDMRHRITANAYEQLTEHRRPAYPQYTEADFMRFCLNELLALAPQSSATLREEYWRRNAENRLRFSSHECERRRALVHPERNRHHHDDEVRG